MKTEFKAKPGEDIQVIKSDKTHGFQIGEICYVRSISQLPGQPVWYECSSYTSPLEGVPPLIQILLEDDFELLETV